MDTKRLRQRVLDLAIHGKLVPQNPQDESASELLKRIAEEKERLVKEGKIKKSKKKDNEDIDEVPFEVPQGWVWCRLGDIACFFNGDRSKNYPNKEEYVSNGIAWINTGHILPNGYLSEANMNYITENKYNSLSSGKIQKGDLVYCLRGATYGKISRVEPFSKGAVASSLMIIRAINIELKEYIYYYLKSHFSKEILLSYANGAAQPNLAANDVAKFTFPLPPLAEQHRIVSEVEKYFSLIDILEESENDLQQSIQKAKSKILDLAIKGKLVEKTGEWEEKKLGDICNYGKCITINVEDIAPDSWVLELEDIEKDTARIQNRISRQERDIKGTRHSFKKGDILYSKLRTYLNKVLVAKEDGFCTTEIIPIKPNECITAEFLCHVMRSKYFVDYTVQCGYGVKMPRLSTTDAKKAIIPLPPLAEQQRIVAKIEELFTQLDNIAEALK